MDNNDRWVTGVVVAAVIILAIGGVAYGISKRHKASAFAGEPNSASCISVDQAAADEGQNGCVQFTVGYTYVSAAGNAYLDQYDGSGSNGYGFSVWMPSSDTFGSNATSQYADKTVDVTGMITAYHGEPEIKVTDSSQINLAQ